MEETESSDGILNWLGEQVGGLLAAIPGALGDFFTGVGEGAGVSGTAIGSHSSLAWRWCCPALRD